MYQLRAVTTYIYHYIKIMINIPMLLLMIYIPLLLLMIYVLMLLLLIMYRNLLGKS